MSCNFHSDNLATSSRSCLSIDGPSCCSSCSNNLVYTTTSCSPSTCQLSSSLNSSCQETCIEPTSFQSSCVVSSPCQVPCYYPRSSTPCRPCQGTYGGSLGMGPSSFCSLDYGSRRCYIMGCGSGGFEPLNYEVSGIPLLSYGYRFCHPTHLAASICQPYYKPTCGNILYGFDC